MIDFNLQILDAMKTYTTLIVIVMCFISCSEIEPVNDPILGVWTIEYMVLNNGEETIEQREWIFNDVFLGRHHRYMNGELVVENDYRWSVSDGIYRMEYNGGTFPDIIFTIDQHGNDAVLRAVDGEVIGIGQGIP